MSDRPLIIGTRGSRLALWQAQHVARRLGELGHPTTQRIITTKGDRVQDLSFDKIEGKGFFTKEIEQELLAGTIDLAVHSCKDLETADPPGLHIAALPGRAASEELLILRPEAALPGRTLHLREGAVVGTSSARRKSQLRLLRPDVVIEDLRGNVPTRVDKLRAGAYDAILLAKAGIDRLELDLSGLQAYVLDPRWFVPAPAQGVLAIQTRTADDRANAAAEELHDDRVALRAWLERRLLAGYRGGCQVPLGVHTAFVGDRLQLWASAARTATELPRRVHLTGTDASRLVEQALEALQRPLRALTVVTTRALQGDELLVRALGAHGIGVTGVELLAPQAVPFQEVPPHQRSFFSSRNAVRCFVQGGGDLKAAPCDAIGPGTAEEIRKLGGAPVFVGDGPDAQAIARSYAERFGHQHVLFPCAAQSQRTVQRAMPAGSTTDLVVYAMHPVAGAVAGKADVAIVTSPDHASAMHALRPLDRFDQVIAMGTSTAQRVMDLCGATAVVPWASNEMALLDAVFGIAAGTPHTPTT